MLCSQRLNQEIATKESLVDSVAAVLEVTQNSAYHRRI